jgi:hypothetical protein
MKAAAQALPGFELHLALFNAELRRSFMSAFPALAKAVVARGTSVPVTSVHDVSKLVPLLNRAHKAVADHVQKGNQAQVIVGCLRFDHGVPVDALCWDGSADEIGDLETHRSAPIEIQGIHQHTLGLEFAWKRGFLAVRLSQLIDAGGALQTSELKESLTVDIAISVSALTLQQRGMRVEIGGGWLLMASGISFFHHGAGTAAEALSKGVSCVLSVRAGSVEAHAPCTVSHALHLDQSCLPAARLQQLSQSAIRRSASW